MYGFLRTENGHEAWLTSEIPSCDVPGATERFETDGWEAAGS